MQEWISRSDNRGTKTGLKKTAKKVFSEIGQLKSNRTTFWCMINKEIRQKHILSKVLLTHVKISTVYHGTKDLPVSLFLKQLKHMLIHILDSILWIRKWLQILKKEMTRTLLTLIDFSRNVTAQKCGESCLRLSK